MIGSYLLKVAVIQLVGYGAYWLALEDTTLHRLKRWYLLVCPLVAFLIPLLTVYTVELPELLPQVEEMYAEFDSGYTPSTLDTYHPAGLILPLYLLGVLIGTIRLVRNLATIRRQRRAAVLVEAGEGAIWYGLTAPVPVHSFGRSIYYSVQDKPSREVRAHELAHVHQLHSLDRVYFRILRIICWFNPVLWLYERATIHNHELLADAAVIDFLRISPGDYQRALLNALTGQRRLRGLSSYLPFSFTKKRFLMLTLPKHSRLNKLARLGLTATVWLVLLFAFGNTAFAQQDPPPPPAPRAPVAPSAVIAPPPPPPAPPTAVLAPPSPPAPPSAVLAPPPPPGVPCPPPPYPSVANLRPYLDMTYVEYWEKITAEYQAKRSGCVAQPSRITDPTVTVRAYLTDFLEDRLKWYRELKPITAEEYEKFQDAKTFGVWLDGKRIGNEALRGRDRTELYRPHKPSRLYRNAKDYGKYVYHLRLASQRKVDADIAKIRAELAEVRE